MGSPAIEVRELRKSYGDVEAVAGVSFEVDRGGVYCLLGPNGAGKTTTVEILEGYRRASSGRVRVLGEDPSGQSRRLFDRIGIVLQSCGVQDDLSVAELLTMYGRYYSRPRPAGELIDIVELDAKAGARAKTLSGGQRRRLDLALALVGDPDLIFLDEPTTGFDPTARRQAWSTIQNLCELGKTVLLTTHYLDEAQVLAQRVGVLVSGEMVAEGSPEDVGGRNRAPTQIRFQLPAGTTPAQLPDLGTSKVTAEGNDVLVETDAGVRVANVVTGWALEAGLALEGFSVVQPSLEDIYLDLIGQTGSEATA